MSGQGSLSQSSLTFDAADWKTPQTVTVTGLNDHLADRESDLPDYRHSDYADGNYNAMAITPVSVTNINTNVAGFTVAPTALTTYDTGTLASFDVTLTSAPK